MITTTADVNKMMCPETQLTKPCVAPRCPIWQWWVPPPGTEKNWLAKTQNTHGVRNEEKKGYCGLVGKI